MPTLDGPKFWIFVKEPAGMVMLGDAATVVGDGGATTVVEGAGAGSGGATVGCAVPTWH